MIFLKKPINKNRSLSFNRNFTIDRGDLLSFVSTNDTITPAIVVSGGPTPIWLVWESTGKAFKYEATSFSHTKTVGTGNLMVRLVNTEAVKDYITEVSLYNNGIISSFFDLQIEKLVNLNYLFLYTNNFTGNLSTVVWPTGLIKLFLYTNNFVGDLTSMIWPTGLTDLRIAENTFTGDLSSTNWPTGLIFYYAYSNNFTSFTVPPVGVSPLRIYQVFSNGASQAAVDAVALALYNNRANFSYATPTVNVGGTNAAPSGIYQDATPPTTGLEYIFKLVNDPDAEGFNKQVWTGYDPV